jgi:membrane-bound inhibitor of C-type lysozyme
MTKRALTHGGSVLPAYLLTAIAATAIPQALLAEAPPADACRALAGTYVTSVSDVEGVFSSRGLATLTADGIFLMSDSAQSGLPGIYDPFSSTQGAWKCIGVEGREIRAKATGLNFVLPGEGRPASFGRTDYLLRMDTGTGVLSGSVALSFTAEGDLESADPISRPGPVLEKFQLEGRRLEPETEDESASRESAAGTYTSGVTQSFEVRIDCGFGYVIHASFRRNDSDESQAVVRLPGGEVSLPRARSGSGARYADNGTELWIKGDEALLTLTGSEQMRCRVSG